jgi:hypothetical protein
MKRSSTLFLKFVIVLMGIAALVVCVFILPGVIGEVSAEGYDPILLGMYVTAIPFFIVLYQGLKLLNYIDKNTAFSELSVNL